MGYPMAGHLVSAGHDVTVFNRSSARADAWVGEHGGRSASSPAEAASGAEYVFLCVGDDPDVREVVAGPDGVFSAETLPKVIVDHTTASAALARELFDEARSRGVGFVDAPISGGQAGAENGLLTVMCGGHPDDFDAVRPLIDAYSRACNLLGDAGSGQLAKMVNQICIAGLVQGLSEGINFAQRAGLDVAAVVDTISKGAAGSWQMENRAQTMADGFFDYGFALDWMRKDLRICFEEAERNGSLLPVATMVDAAYAQLQQQGHGRWDTSSLIELLRK
jgi:3-hydroxyisobutyrate dehydrogenase-like beta-hydroxyacid dehydrogenase